MIVLVIARQDRLATIKHKNEIPTSQQKDWPSLLCFDKTYVEAIFLQPPTLASIECVRISMEYLRQLEALTF